MHTETEPSTIFIRSPRKSDKAAWEQLWAGYLTFYRHQLPDEISEYTWQRLLRDEPPLRGFFAVDEADQPIGFVHYVLHASTWTTTQYCYLEDLFVRPERRGQGIGKALIEHLYRLADENNYSRVYWMTQENNYAGRTLYDRVGRKLDFVIYERDE